MTPDQNSRERTHRLRSRTDEWHAVGLGSEIERMAHSPRFYRGEVVVLVGLIVAVLFLFDHRSDLLPGSDLAGRMITVIALIILGWALARAVARGLAPPLMRRIDPGLAGTLGFLLRLITVAFVVLIALRVAGVQPSTLAAGGAFTAILLGLAAQQTLSNLFAGLVLQSARPFRVGERVRVVAGMLAGQIEGVVGSLGLFYTTFVNGADRIMVPNSLLINAALVPLREPDSTDLSVRLQSFVAPAALEERLQRAITVPLRYPPHVAVKEITGHDVLMQVEATPQNPADGARLTEQVMRAVREIEPHSEMAHSSGVAETML